MIKKTYFLIFLLLSCTNDPNLLKEFISENHLPIEQITDAELLHTENGKLKVKIFAGKIERFTDKQPELFFSKNIKIFFYNESEEIQSKLYSENATVDKKSKIMVAYNNVNLIGNDNRSLETEELIWDQVSDRIYTEKDVKITTNNEIISGKGFYASPDFTKYEITNINGTFDVIDELE